MTHLLGLVPLVGRGPLVHGSIGGLTLVDLAIRLMSRVADQVIVVLADDATPGVSHRDVEQVTLPSDEPILRRLLHDADRVLVHDPLCPLVPERFVRQLLDADPVSVRVAVRPVVDTIKATQDGAISGTVDRDQLRVVSSPIVAPGHVFAGIEGLPGALADLTALVSRLRAAGDVELVVAPSVSRRVEDTSGLRLITSVDAVSHRVRERN